MRRSDRSIVEACSISPNEWLRRSEHLRWSRLTRVWPRFCGRTIGQGACACRRRTDGDNHPVLLETERQLLEYFDGRRKNFALTLDVSGTPFQRSVWNALLTIPFGETRSVRADRPTDWEPRGGACGRRRQRQKPGLDRRAVPSSRRRLGCAYGFCRRSRCQGTAVTLRASPARRPHALTYHCTFRSRG